MKIPRISLVLTLILIMQANSNCLYAQNFEKKSYKNNITFNITRLALMEARFGYERHLTDRHVLRTTLGIQFPVTSNSFPYVFYVPFYYIVSKGMYMAVGYNYIFNQGKNLYVSAEVYYNYNTYDNKYYRHCTGHDGADYVSLQSMELRKSGIKFLFGKKLFMSPVKDTRLQFDFFAGIGVQYRQEEITIFKKKTGECTVDGQYHYENYDPPKEEDSYAWWPTLHAGLLLSFPF